MSKCVVFEGISYNIEYKKELSKNYYGRESVYYITTEEDNYSKAKKVISEAIEERYGFEKGYIWNLAIRKIKMDNCPSMENAFHPYFKFTYDPDKDVFIYTFIQPYDD